MGGNQLNFKKSRGFGLGLGLGLGLQPGLGLRPRLMVRLRQRPRQRLRQRLWLGERLRLGLGLGLGLSPQGARRRAQRSQGGNELNSTGASPGPNWGQPWPGLAAFGAGLRQG